MQGRWLLAAVAAGALAGCGGGGGAGGGSAPNVSRAQARFQVDLTTNKVTITPADGRAAFQGGAVSFTSSDVISVGGDAGQRLIRVTATNQSGQTWGSAPVRMRISSVGNSAAAALRANVKVSTFAGDGTYSVADGYRTSAGMYATSSLASAAGPLEGCLAAITGQAVRLIQPDGMVSTFAGGAGGFADGFGAAARFYFPAQIASDASGALFVADTLNQRVRRITPLGQVTTIAGTGVAGATDGAGTAATFRSPAGVAVSPDGTRIYISDAGNQTIRLLTCGSGARDLASSYTVTTIAGLALSSGSVDGVGVAARFASPQQLALLTDAAGNETLFVPEFSGVRVRRITSPSGAAVVSTIAGDGVAGSADGPGSLARFVAPVGICARWLDASSFVVFVAMPHAVRAITYAGGGTPTQAGSYLVSTLAGGASAGYLDGDGNTAVLAGPRGLAAVGTGTSCTLYVGEYDGCRVRQVAVPGGALHTGGAGAPVLAAPKLLNWDSEALDGASWTRVLSGSGNVWSGDIQFNVPQGVSGFSFLATIETDTNVVNLPAAGSSTITTLAGGDVAGALDGAGGQAMLNWPRGIVAVPTVLRSLYRAPTGAPIRAFIADANNCRIRFLDTQGFVGTWAGSTPGNVNAIGTAARLNYPYGVCLMPDGSLIVGQEDGIIRRVWPNQQVTTVAGTGTAGSVDGAGDVAQFSFPRSLGATGGGVVYVADCGGQIVRRITLTGPDPRSPASYTVVTVAGSPGVRGSLDGDGASARFADPWGLAVDSDGTVWVVDYTNHAVRQLRPSGVNTMNVTTLNTMLSGPFALALDRGHSLYVADVGSRQIVRLNSSSQPVPVAGTGFQGLVDGPSGQVWLPTGVTVEESGSLLFTDKSALREVSRIVDSAGL